MTISAVTKADVIFDINETGLPLGCAAERLMNEEGRIAYAKCVSHTCAEKVRERIKKQHMMMRYFNAEQDYFGYTSDIKRIIADHDNVRDMTKADTAYGQSISADEECDLTAPIVYQRASDERWFIMEHDAIEKYLSLRGYW